MWLDNSTRLRFSAPSRHLPSLRHGNARFISISFYLFLLISSFLSFVFKSALDRWTINIECPHHEGYIIERLEEAHIELSLAVFRSQRHVNEPPSVLSDEQRTRLNVRYITWGLDVSLDHAYEWEYMYTNSVDAEGNRPVGSRWFDEVDVTVGRNGHMDNGYI